MRALILTSLATVTFACVLLAQSQAPIVVPAAAPNAAAPRVAPANPNSESTAAMLKVLQDMKTANEQTLKKQGAALQQLDELEKVAEQIRLYTRRS